MIRQTDFNAMVELAMTSSSRRHMRPVVEKELLHYDILFSLDKEGLLDSLTFQGGTSLRLCYGSSRFSEDLNFTGGADFDGRMLQGIKSCIEKQVGRRYGLEVSVKEPADIEGESDYAGLSVDKWQVAVVTAPERRDLPKQRIKVEVANIPSYSRELKSLIVNYDFLPDGYGDTLILVETLDEVMADKLVSLVNTIPYVLHRDIWDLRWLKLHGASIKPMWIKKKVDDYGIDDYLDKLDNIWQQLPDIIYGAQFRKELTRFTPVDVQESTLLKKKFYDFLVTEIRNLLQSVKWELTKK